MKIKVTVFTVCWDDDGGTGCMVFGDEDEALDYHLRSINIQPGEELYDELFKLYRTDNEAYRERYWNIVEEKFNGDYYTIDDWEIEVDFNDCEVVTHVP